MSDQPCSVQFLFTQPMKSQEKSSATVASSNCLFSSASGRPEEPLSLSALAQSL